MITPDVRWKQAENYAGCKIVGVEDLADAACAYGKCGLKREQKEGRSARNAGGPIGSEGFQTVALPSECCTTGRDQTATAVRKGEAGSPGIAASLLSSS